MRPRSVMLTRRSVLTTILGTTGALLAACSAPATPPVPSTPAAGAAKPTEAPKPAAPAAASPAAGASPATAASPAASPAAAASPGASPSPAAAASGPSQQATASVITGNYEITFLTTQTGAADVAIYEQLANRFHELNSNLTVKVTAE